MKYEWRKEEKDLYQPKGVVTLRVPEQKFITLAGAGNPNLSDFSTHISALYPVAYSIRMKLKKAGFEYTVYPLEGVWTTSDGSKNEYLNKDALLYKIMIKQPESVTKKMFADAVREVVAKKDNPYFTKVQFETVPAHQAVQMINVGPFDTEIESFKLMEEYLAAHNLKKTTMMGDFQHREVYLSDFRRVAPEKQKTLLRYAVI